MTHSAVRILSLICLAGVLGTVMVVSLVPARWSPPIAQLPDLKAMAPQSIVIPGESAPVEFEQVALRPLFLASRRPYVAPTMVEPVEVGPDPFAKVELVGIFGSGRNVGVILKRGNQTHRIGLGAQWNDWELQSVDERAISAVFVSQDRDARELKLTRQPQQGPLVTASEPRPARWTEQASDAVADPEEADADDVIESRVESDPASSARRARPERRTSPDARLPLRHQRANQ